jgi:hypothetical protein
MTKNILSNGYSIHVDQHAACHATPELQKIYRAMTLVECSEVN